MAELFDRHDTPVLAGRDAESAWAAILEFEDYVYNTADGVSDAEWDRRIDMIRALHDEYFDLFE